jgi:hypothetical protein
MCRNIQCDFFFRLRVYGVGTKQSLYIVTTPIIDVPVTRRLVVAGSTSGAGQEYTSPTAWSQTFPTATDV